MEQQFNELFRGLDRAYGTYRTNGQTEDNGKAKGKGTTVNGPVTDELWAAHLAGTQRLGIVPVTDEGTAYFGAIDIDKYDLDLALVESRVQSLGLPLVLCRSKSGGAHLYLFTDGVDAALVRDKLASWATAIGFPGVEIFPKQSRLASKTDVGNWINMPYFEAELTTTYALHGKQPLSPADFLGFANGSKVTAEQLEAVQVQAPDLPDGAPPCLQALAINGAPEGTRNNALFAFGVLARKAAGEGWEDLAQQFNQLFMDPPLPWGEVNGVIKSLSGKEYFYPCDNPPLNSFCDKRACKKCKFGVGGGDGPSDPGVLIDGVVKILTDPPTWIFRIAGVNVEMETDDFLSQTRFKRKVAEKLNRIPRSIKQHKWEQLVNDLLQHAEEEEAPEDASSYGQFLAHLRDFCNRQSRGTTKESLLTNGLYLNEDEERVYFRSTYLEKYLDQQKFRDYSKRQIWAAIRKIPGFKHHQEMIKERNIQHWSIPAVDIQKDDFTPPTMPQEEF